ncbi:ATP-binding protein [Streptomyces gilvosporeus]|uniref:AAA family ATPase n=1 Tax=Streptomyces gilvosporeus TaxID=553510 RepID=A0A1V0TX33_9ACTN|nr:ATP-binding protein [Streptomyces gilvosporeus]ARF57447.1 AAA family ATPase [Streptomyces gilvosporeus]
MDPNTDRGPEEYGEQVHPAQAPTPPFGTPQEGSGGQARVVRLVSGGYLVTVNPIDGSEIEPCPPGERPAVPGKLTAQERTEAARAAAPPVPAGPPGSAGRETVLEERSEETERLVRLLSRGRSVRVTGPSGSGRTRLLDAVAGACADLAPDGVIRLSGYHRTPTDVLHALFAAVYRAPRHRPDRPELLRRLGAIGAIVVLDDLEFGGTGLDELLDATPECAFLIAATPDVPAPSAGCPLEEVFLGGIGRSACVRMLERAVGRSLTADEEAWAADLWFESEGLPLRFVQAAELLRRRDRTVAEADAAAPDGTEEPAADAAAPDETAATPGAHPDGPLPTLGEAASPVPLLAARLGPAAQETLRFAVALGGELPHQSHLPALTEDTHADAVLGELLDAGLISPAGSHYRLAATVVDQLTAVGYAEGAAARAHTAAQHYAWWAGHPSVTPERAAAEADVVLAAMGVLTGSREAGHASAAVLLARTAAPAFAAGLYWSAWERSLRHGQEAARRSGEVAEEAYFHHELGVLALCSGSLDRARAELEASIGLRGVLSDRRGAVAGRRALALVSDRSRAASAAADTTALKPVGLKAGTGAKAAAAPKPPAGASPDAVSTAKLRAARPEPADATVVARRATASTGGAATTVLPATGTGAKRTARRNIVAAGAGAVLVAVLGTVITLGMTSGGDDSKGGHVTSEQTTPDGQNPELPTDGPTSGSGRPSTGPGTSAPGHARHTGRPSPSASDTGTASPTDPGTQPSDPSSGPTDPTTGPTAPTDRPTEPTHKPTSTPTPTPTQDPTPTEDPTPTQGPTGKPSTQSPSQSTAAGAGPDDTTSATASGTPSGTSQPPTGTTSPSEAESTA